MARERRRSVRSPQTLHFGRTVRLHEPLASPRTHPLSTEKPPPGPAPPKPTQTAVPPKAEVRPDHPTGVRTDFGPMRKRLFQTSWSLPLHFHTSMGLDSPFQGPTSWTGAVGGGFWVRW